MLHRLYLLGLVGGQAPRGMAETDILVMRTDGTDVATVQVKARQSLPSDGGWHMSRKHEGIVRDNLYYVFVGFETTPPRALVIPSAVVADVISQTHQAWLAAPGKNRQPHRDSDFRRLLPAPGWGLVDYPDGWAEEYSERWDLLSSGSTTG